MIKKNQLNNFFSNLYSNIIQAKQLKEIYFMNNNKNSTYQKNLNSQLIIIRKAENFVAVQHR